MMASVYNSALYTAVVFWEAWYSEVTLEQNEEKYHRPAQ
jgi:hypothetical protein